MMGSETPRVEDWSDLRLYGDTAQAVSDELLRLERELTAANLALKEVREKLRLASELCFSVAVSEYRLEHQETRDRTRRAIYAAIFKLIN